MGVRKRATDIDLTDRFDMSDLVRKERKVKQDLKDIWCALDGLPAIRVTPEMIIERIKEKNGTAKWLRKTT